MEPVSTLQLPALASCPPTTTSSPAAVSRLLTRRPTSLAIMGAAQGKEIHESVLQLRQATIPAGNEQFWKRFFTASLTPADLVTHVPTKELLNLRQNHTRNYAVLVIQVRQLGLFRLRKLFFSQRTVT